MTSFAPQRMGPAYYFSRWTTQFLNMNQINPILSPDPNRVLIFVADLASGGANIFPTSSTNSSFCWTIGAVTPGYLLTYHDYGALLGEAWFASSATLNLNLFGWSMGFDPGRLSDQAREAAPGSYAPPPPPADPSSLPREDPTVNSWNAPAVMDPQRFLDLKAEQAKQRDALRKLFPQA